MTKKSTQTEKHVAFAFANFGAGGAQRAMLRLCDEFLSMSYRVDLIVLDRDRKSYDLPDDPRVRVFPITRNLFFQIMALHKWSAENTFVPVLATQENVTRVMALAKRLGVLRGNIILREANRIGMQSPRGQSRLWAPFMPWLYRAASGYISLSQAARADLAALVGVDPQSIPLIPNALDQQHVFARGQEPLGHPWFAPSRPCPVVLGVGRLVEQKGFDTLIDAVALLRQTRRVRLVILGQGPLREKLSTRAMAAGLDEDFALPGFQNNPYAFMARCDVFALSSRWEGSPNALLEAMATGAAVVACDCPSGPREVLLSPELGALVAVDDVEGVAAALRCALEHPGSVETRIAHIRQNHGVEDWARAYEQAILKALK